MLAFPYTTKLPQRRSSAGQRVVWCQAHGVNPPHRGQSGVMVNGDPPPPTFLGGLFCQAFHLWRAQRARRVITGGCSSNLRPGGPTSWR